MAGLRRSEANLNPRAQAISQQAKATSHLTHMNSKDVSHASTLRSQSDHVPLSESTLKALTGMPCSSVMWKLSRRSSLPIPSCFSFLRRLSLFSRNAFFAAALPCAVSS